MDAISLFKWMLMNTNYENHTALQYYITENERVMIRQFLLLYTQMPNDPDVDDNHSETMRSYSKKVLQSMFPNTEDGNKEFEDLIKNNAENVKKLFRFEDRRPPKTNKLLNKAINNKVPIIKLLSDLKNDGIRYFENEMINMTLIDIMAHKAGHPDSRSLLDEIIPEYINNPQKKMMLIRGPGGAGKTTLLNQLLYLQWLNYSLGKSEYMPLHVNLVGVEKNHDLVESALSQFNGGNFANSIKNSSTKVLLLIDNYDELRQPVNLWNLNHLDEWDGTIKVIIASRGDYLVSYNDYTTFFIPGQKENAFSDYIISDIDTKQVADYIHKHHKCIKSGDKQDEKLTGSLKITNNLQQAFARNVHLKTLIEQVISFQDICKTPYMLKILVEIMPKLQEKFKGWNLTGEGARYAGLTSVYDTFTKNYFANNLKEIMESSSTELPPHFDLYQSFYNFSCNFAITLWLDNKTYCQVENNSFPFPKKIMSQQDQKFKILFSNDPKTLYARMGAPIYQAGGTAKFNHLSIQNYFVSKVLIEELKHINPKNMQSLQNSYLNEKQLIASDDQDQEILQFIWGKIKNYNRRIGSDHGISTKLAQCIEEFLDELADTDEDPIYVNNLMIISSKIERCFPLIKFEQKDLQSIQKIMNNPDVDSAFKCQFGLHASKFFYDLNRHAANDLKKASLAYRLGGISYEGEVTEDAESGEVVANCENGTLIFANGNQYRGGFKQNKFHGKGDMLYQYELDDEGKTTKTIGDCESYEGQFVNGQKEGEGTERFAKLVKMVIKSHEGDTVYEEGKDVHFGDSYYQGEFHDGEKKGSGTRYFDGENLVYNGSYKHNQRDGQGNLIVKYPNHEWVYQGNWKSHQPHGVGKIIIGKYGKLSNTVFEGKFSSGAATGKLTLKDGQVIEGELRYHQTRGFSEHGLWFYTKKQIEDGADKSIVVYQMKGEETYHKKEFNKRTNANEFYNTLHIDDNCTAKIHLHDLNVVPDSNEKSGYKKQGQTPLDVEKIVATVIKMGYYEERDKDGNIKALSREALNRQMSLAGNVQSSFDDFVSNMQDKKYVGVYKFKSDDYRNKNFQPQNSKQVILDPVLEDNVEDHITNATVRAGEKATKIFNDAVVNVLGEEEEQQIQTSINTQPTAQNDNDDY